MQYPERIILKPVDKDPAFESLIENSHIERGLGFLVSTDPDGLVKRIGRQSVVLGFANSGWQDGEIAADKTFTNKAKLEDIKEDYRTLDRQGRGTGARLYNTVQALAGAKEHLPEVGLYAFAIDLNNLKRSRFMNGLRMQQARSFAMRALAKAISVGSLDRIDGEEAMIQGANWRTENFDGILYDQTPDGEKQKSKRGVVSEYHPDRFIVVRRKNAKFTRVGVQTDPWQSHR